MSREGFKVEAGTGGMPTAFCATFENGDGPTIAAYAEYDAVPGNCQVAAARKGPRPGLSKYAPGHTDPHSALGISALGGVLGWLVFREVRWRAKRRKDAEAANLAAP